MPLSETTKKKKSLMKDMKMTPEAISPKHGTETTPCTTPCISEIDVNSLPYDERPLPALRNKSKNQPQPQTEETASPLDQGIPHSPGVTGEPEPLSEKVQKEAGLPIQVFGDRLVAGAYSQNWSYREHSLLIVYQKLAEVSPETPNAELTMMMRAAVFLCNKALADKVSSVFQASLKLLRMILKEFVSSHQLGKSEISYCVEHIWPSLLSQTGESKLTLRSMAFAFIQEMAVYKEVCALQLVPSELVKPIKSCMPVRLTLSRLELLENLLEQLGTTDSGFTVNNVMPFLLGALEHCAAPVRELAVRIVQIMYRLHGRSILSYLPPDNDCTRKNILYKNLFDSFSKIDISLPQSQKKGKQKKTSPEKKTETPHQAGVNKEPHSMSTDGKGSQSIQNQNLCFFCGLEDESFTEDGLILHYWKHCPMLCRCLLCGQFVEIARLTEHLLSECEHKAAFSQCPRCSEAIIRNKLSEHAQSTACNPLPDQGNCNHCPLCHENFCPGEKGWIFHLMDSSAGCEHNARRTVAPQRANTHTQGRTMGTASVESVGKGREGRSITRIHAQASRPSRATKGKP